MADKFLDYTGLSYLWGKITAALSGKQNTLVSGTNIKTVNNQSLLGNGNIDIGDMSKVTNPTENDILTTNSSGQAVDSGVQISDIPHFDEVSEKFFTKQSTRTSTGLIKKLKGNTLVFNQLVQNGNFVDTSNWIASNSSISVSNNEATVTFNRQWASVRSNCSLEYNHKYYVRADIKMDSAGNTRIGLGDAGYMSSQGVFLQFNPSDTNYHTYEIYGTLTEVASASAKDIVIQNANNSSRTGYIKNVMVIDLTLMFGSGNEPTSFTNLFPLPYYDYNAGSLLSFNGTGLKTENASQTESNILSLPISTYFPTGMKSAGSVYDELTSNKVIVRAGSVDMGTLTWYAQSTYGFYTTGLSSVIKSPVDNYTKANIICAIRETSTWSDLETGGTGTNYIAVSSGYLGIADNSGKTAIQFKESLSGVYLYYELATPTEQDIIDENYLVYKVYDGGIVELQPVNTSTPSTTEIDMIVDYAVNKVVVTSELINDGDGTSAFATKSYLETYINRIETFGNADFTYQQELDPDTQEVINECVAYSTVTGNADEPKAVKCGRVVNMSGAFKNINVRPSNATFVMGKVPSGCEPLYRQSIMQQGSDQYKYLLTIETDGTLKCARYSESASAIAVTNGAWLNINATYISAS